METRRCNGKSWLVIGGGGRYILHVMSLWELFSFVTWRVKLAVCLILQLNKMISYECLLGIALCVVR